MRLFDFLPSGNGYKVRLLLKQTDTPFDWVNLDIIEGETRTDSFLAKNPNGRIPLLELDDGRLIPESNAILFYLAEDTPFIASDRFLRAQTLQWMFFEQYSHEPYVAVSRFIHEFCEPGHERFKEVPSPHAKGYAALAVMDQHLKTHNYFVADQYSIADIALYAYTHVAEEGGYDLTKFEHVREWLARVANEPGHIPITFSEF